MKWPHFDLSFPEDVLIEVLHNKREPRGWYVVEALVLGSSFGSKILGAATYEQDYGCLLHYVIKDLILGKPDEGFWVVLGVSADCKKSYFWRRDDDIKFLYQDMREAAEEERLLLR